MKFRDEEVEKFDITEVDDIVQLIVEYMCGYKYLCVKKVSGKSSKCEKYSYDRELLDALLKNAKTTGLNYGLCSIFTGNIAFQSFHREVLLWFVNVPGTARPAAYQ